MNNAFRGCACMLLLACSGLASSQDSPNWISAEWSPKPAENERSFKEAERQFNEALAGGAKARGERGHPAPPPGGRDGHDGPAPGAMREKRALSIFTR